MFLFSRLGQKGRSLKHNNDNQPLFQNKTAEANLGSSFHIRTPENLANGFEKLDLVHDTPFVQPVIRTQNDSGIETLSDTLISADNKLPSSNNRPNFSLSTKRSLYNNKENLPEQINDMNSEFQKFTHNDSNSSSYSLTVKKNVEETANKSFDKVKDDTCFVSPETSKYNNDTSLYHSIRETTVVPVPDSSYLLFSTKNHDSLIDSSLSNKQLGCQPLDGKPNYASLELSPAAKRNDFVIHSRSPIRPPLEPLEFVQDGEFKRPITSSGSVCVKCANENYICVKGINYSILNTLGHGGSSVVYEVNNKDVCVVLTYF